MSCLRLICFCIFSFFLPNLVRAETGSPCTNISSYKTLLQCISEHHPEVIRANEALRQISLEEDVARQIPNPELDSKAVFGSVPSGSTHETEVALLHTFELGGKRSSRIEKARAEGELAKAETEKSRAEALAQTILTLRRLRQLKAEQGIVEDGIATFSRVLRNFKNRPRLSPEQQVSSDIFQLAKADYDIKQSALTLEESELRKAIELSVGEKLDWKPSLLPDASLKWPVFSANSDPASWRGPKLLATRAELQASQAALSAANGESWPDLKIGPAFKSQSDGQNSYSQFGLSLSLPIPLYQRNSAGRSFALQGVSRSETSLKLVRQEAESEHELQLEKYKAAVKILTGSVSASEIEKKRKSAVSLFERGMISGQIVIEAQRQILDLTKSQNEQELSALRALTRIYAIEGKNIEDTPL